MATYCLLEVLPFGGGSVVVWEEVCGKESAPLIIANVNLAVHCHIDVTLRLTALACLQQQPRGVITPDPHTARIVQTFLANNVSMLPGMSQ